MILFAALLLQTTGGGAVSLGIFERWGAFRDANRCFAIAQPARARSSGYVTIANVPARAIRSQFHTRLGATPAQGAQVTLSIGERRFQLVARDGHAWAADARADAAIVGAIRSARSMSVESVDTQGRPFADAYALRGAATAIDAAAIACARAR